MNPYVLIGTALIVFGIAISICAGKVAKYSLIAMTILGGLGVLSSGIGGYILSLVYLQLI